MKKIIDLHGLSHDKALIKVEDFLLANSFSNLLELELITGNSPLLQKKNNKDHEVLEIFEDIVRDLNNYDLEFRIQELESKFSEDLSEVTYNELKEHKKKQNIN